MREAIDTYQRLFKNSASSPPIIVLAKLGLLEIAVNFFTEVGALCGMLEETGKKQNNVCRDLNELVKANRIRAERVDREISQLSTGDAETILLALSRNNIVILEGKKVRKTRRRIRSEVVETLIAPEKVHP